MNTNVISNTNIYFFVFKTIEYNTLGKYQIEYDFKCQVKKTLCSIIFHSVEQVEFFNFLKYIFHTTTCENQYDFVDDKLCSQ